MIDTFPRWNQLCKESATVLSDVETSSASADGNCMKAL